MVQREARAGRAAVKRECMGQCKPPIKTPKEKEIEINKSYLLLQESAANSGTVLQMYSGGRDSLLAACRLLDVRHSILLVTYDKVVLCTMIMLRQQLTVLLKSMEKAK